MHEKLSWIEHAGKKILCADWQNLSDKIFVDAVDGIIEVYGENEADSLLVLIDITNSFANEEVKSRMEKANKVSAAKKIAGVGVVGVKRIIANVVRKGIYFARDSEDAKNWLVSE